MQPVCVGAAWSLRGVPVHQAGVAVHHPHHLRRPGAVRDHLLRALQGTHQLGRPCDLLVPCDLLATRVAVPH